MQDVTCPNCSHPMRLVRHLPLVNDEEQVNVFECKRCRVNFVTEDHLPIAGDTPPGDRER